MKIWVDADACPVQAKEILFRAADRTKTLVTFVANQYIKVPPSPFIRMQQVSSGFDVADDEIAKQAAENDLVITSDIPLASEVIDKGAHALNPRGEMYTTANIKQKLNIRDFMDTMRASGVQSGGQAKYSDRDKQEFANQLDRFITKAKLQG
ncbi:MAG: YaiI/YqxD family protein [Gammaproteobacteria bacterium]|nr:YaiI/YqxD family protein [Gammaproteobacteria bacterium]